MPIIEPADSGLPLSQGDILKDVHLFVTKEVPEDSGGEYLKTTHKLCLVISRPCVIGHKPYVVVAAIEKMGDNVPRDVETLDDIVNFLTDLRDGPDSPDVFYLGQVPGHEGRFGARLDSLHTVGVPKDSEAQRRFTDRKRVGRLTIDFVRDLHTRIFRAFATLGFDDHHWLSTHDLRWLTSRGRQEVHDAHSALDEAQTALLSAQARGFRNEGERTQLERAIAAAQAALDGITRRLEPYEAELKTRDK